MRVRAFVAIVSLLLPAISSAQRLPVPGTAGRRGPAQPVPLSPQPEPIARAVEYQRWNLSIESYPLVSFVRAPGLSADPNVSGWSSIGAGTHAEYRLMPFMSGTLDVTTSIFGGPAYVSTAELGTRIRPDRSLDRRVYPFVDARFGYIMTSDRGLSSSGEDPFGNPRIPGSEGVRYARGWGGIAGAGVEYDLTRTLSLTTSASLLHTRLTSHDFRSTGPVDPTFAMRAIRYSIGLRYNPVRVLKAVGPGQL
jgi:hypothetical protein